MISTYFNHQYERMGQLETQRLTMSNLILGGSVLAFSLAFDDLEKLNWINAVGLPIAVIAANLMAIAYIWRSREFIKMHQDRADDILDRFAPELAKIALSRPKPRNSDTDPLSRHRLQTAVHVIVVELAFVIMIIFLS